MNILCCGESDWPEIFRKGEGRIFFDELEPYSLGSQHARRTAVWRGLCCVSCTLTRGRGALTAAEEDLILY